MMPTITLDDDRAGGAALQRGEVQRRATGILVINDEGAIGLAAVDLIAHRDFTIAFIDLDLADVHGRQVIRPHGT